MSEKIKFHPGRKINTAPGTPNDLMYFSKAYNKNTSLWENNIKHTHTHKKNTVHRKGLVCSRLNIYIYICL